MQIAIIREGKTPPDRRVPLLPEQCLALQVRYPQLSFLVQPSPIRCVPDEAYISLGLKVQEDVSEASVFLGVKEVPIPTLHAQKMYFFFSHTMKKQAYNRTLLQTILKKEIQLIDYECLTDVEGKRVVAFGRFAGIVGAYNALRGYGLKHGLFDLKPAIDCRDLEEIRSYLSMLQLPPLKIALTGRGRVSKGAQEILAMAGVQAVSKETFLHTQNTHAVYTVLGSQDYYQTSTEPATSFYENPQNFVSNFKQFYEVADILITGHFWDMRAAALFSAAETQSPAFKLQVIADISCDVCGSVPITLRTSSIDAPFYDYNPQSLQEEKAFQNPENITIMAVDNLPSELPLDASRAFGAQLMEHVFPALLEGDKDGILARASIAKAGKLTEKFSYLEDYVNG